MIQNSSLIEISELSHIHCIFPGLKNCYFDLTTELLIQNSLPDNLELSSYILLIYVILYELKGIMREWEEVEYFKMKKDIK